MRRTVRSTGETPARDCPHEFWGDDDSIFARRQALGFEGKYG
ncbi:hypothetical protein [Scytonema sp. NUACC21]